VNKTLRFGCGIPIRVFLCYVVSMAIVIVVSVDLGMHDNIQNINTIMG
jgi:hypothetical protein